jgi:hypothetical protein
LHIQNFSYGTIYTLLYGSWQEIKSQPTLSGISNTVLGLFHQLMFAKPSLFQIIDSKELFDATYAETNYGYSGFDFNASPIPYVKCKHSWQKWKCEWLSKNQEEIIWDKAQDPFLPNRNYSTELLWGEVIKHNKANGLKKYSGNKVTTFYEEVMRKKGPQIEAYARQIGGAIAKANYYSLDKELSKKESKAVRGSLRAIYSLTGSHGKKEYISIDHKHGMFEYYNFRGIHQGEFRFDGTKNKNADLTHNLKTL